MDGKKIKFVCLFPSPFHRLFVLHFQSPREGPLLHQRPGVKGENLWGAALSEEGYNADVHEMVMPALLRSSSVYKSLHMAENLFPSSQWYVYSLRGSGRRGTQIHCGRGPRDTAAQAGALSEWTKTWPRPDSAHPLPLVSALLFLFFCNIKSCFFYEDRILLLYCHYHAKR